MSKLARLVGLSAPSVSEHVRRLEASGAITEFAIDVDSKVAGYR